uniref:Uncharacterized protein n=1 Tax=Rhinolophus ferrumequinum TaxID=59479 RepID=A0A671E1K2_RHIFE
SAKFFSAFSDFYKRAGLWWMATLDFPIALLETFELGPTLFQGPEEAILPQPLSYSPIYLAVSMTVSESLIKFILTENCKESSGLFIAPVHTGHLLILKAPGILFHPASLSPGW